MLLYWLHENLITWLIYVNIFSTLTFNDFTINIFKHGLEYVESFKSAVHLSKAKLGLQTWFFLNWYEVNEYNIRYTLVRMSLWKWNVKLCVFIYCYCTHSIFHINLVTASLWLSYSNSGFHNSVYWETAWLTGL